MISALIRIDSKLRNCLAIQSNGYVLFISLWMASLLSLWTAILVSGPPLIVGIIAAIFFVKNVWAVHITGSEVLKRLS
jgi:hypothetical protein